MRNLVIWPSKKLSVPSIDIDVFNEETTDLAKELTDKLRELESFGLAACQLGSNVRMLVVTLGPGEDFFDKNIVVFVNPTIVSISGKLKATHEQCTSLPGITVEVKTRYENITVAAFDVDGAPFQLSLTGRDAVILQHEMSHLDGTTLLDEVGPTKRRMLKMKLLKQRKK